MKFYSRSISAILAFSIMGMSSAPAFATSGHLVDSVNFLPSTIYLDIESDTNIRLVNQYSPEAIKATQTECSDIYEITDKDQYVILSENNEPEFVNRISVNTKSFVDNQHVFEKYNISEVAVDAIKETLEQQKDNPDLEVYVYTPSYTISNPMLTSSSTPVYDTKDEIIEFRNMNTGYFDTPHA